MISKLGMADAGPRHIYSDCHYPLRRSRPRLPVATNLCSSLKAYHDGEGIEGESCNAIGKDACLDSDILTLINC